MFSVRFGLLMKSCKLGAQSSSKSVTPIFCTGFPQGLSRCSWVAFIGLNTSHSVCKSHEKSCYLHNFCIIFYILLTFSSLNCEYVPNGLVQTAVLVYLKYLNDRIQTSDLWMTLRRSEGEKEGGRERWKGNEKEVIYELTRQLRITRGETHNCTSLTHPHAVCSQTHMQSGGMSTWTHCHLQMCISSVRITTRYLRKWTGAWTQDRVL